MENNRKRQDNNKNNANGQRVAYHKVPSTSNTIPFNVGAFDARVGSRGANRRGRRCLHSAATDMMDDRTVRAARRVVIRRESRGGVEAEVEARGTLELEWVRPTREYRATQGVLFLCSCNGVHRTFHSQHFASSPVHLPLLILHHGPITSTTPHSHIH